MRHTYDCCSTRYWEENKKRLDKLTHAMLEYNPGMQVPFVFTYFPTTNVNISEDLKKVNNINSVFVLFLIFFFFLNRYLCYWVFIQIDL